MATVDRARPEQLLAAEKAEYVRAHAKAADIDRNTDVFREVVTQLVS